MMVDGKDVRRPVATATSSVGLTVRAQIDITAGHKMKISVDTAYAKKCDDKVMFVDYGNLPKMISEDKPIYVDDGILSFKACAHLAPLHRASILT